jgi:hypothetical protein
VSDFDHALLRIEWGLRGTACILYAVFTLQWALFTEGVL